MVMGLIAGAKAEEKLEKALENKRGGILFPAGGILGTIAVLHCLSGHGCCIQYYDRDVFKKCGVRLIGRLPHFFEIFTYLTQTNGENLL